MKPHPSVACPECDGVSNEMCPICMCPVDYCDFQEDDEEDDPDYDLEF